jgi:hypothetical protein
MIFFAFCIGFCYFEQVRPLPLGDAPSQNPDVRTLTEKINS